MRVAFLLACLLLFRLFAQSQDPEFPKQEFTLHAKLHNGFITNFHSNAPDQYVGGIQIVPQFVIIENRLRGGIIADGFYSGKKVQAAVGPTLSYKLATIQLKKFGSGGNLHLSLDHLWGTNNQRLLGGGLNIDLLNFVTTGISAHRDYNLNTWWFQTSFGIRISKVKQPPHP